MNMCKNFARSTITRSSWFCTVSFGVCVCNCIDIECQKHMPSHHKTICAIYVRAYRRVPVWVPKLSVRFWVDSTVLHVLRPYDPETMAYTKSKWNQTKKEEEKKTLNVCSRHTEQSNHICLRCACTIGTYMCIDNWLADNESGKWHYRLTFSREWVSNCMHLMYIWKKKKEKKKLTHNFT